MKACLSESPLADQPAPRSQRRWGAQSCRALALRGQTHRVSGGDARGRVARSVRSYERERRSACIHIAQNRRTGSRWAIHPLGRVATRLALTA